jgi:triosephosphate isomerase (TIM)
MKQRFLAGNWKMFLERRTALALAEAVRARADRREDLDVALFPPFVYIDELARALSGSRVEVGAQNCCDETEGAFTGEVSARMLVDVGASSVILGHSERRHLFGESDALVQRKVHAALAAGLKVILCVGETLAQREAVLTGETVRTQLTAGLEGVDAPGLQRVTVAYEPVWAIGTGKNATATQASDVHTYLRGLLAELYSPAQADRVRILYGGSVKPDNAAELLSAPNVDGALIGGASLKAETFLPILELRDSKR